MQLLSLKFSAGWFMPFQMVTLSYGRNFSWSVETRVSHIYWRSAIHTMPLSLELLQCVLAKPSMFYRSVINLKSSHRSIPHRARNAHATTHLDVTTALLKSLPAKVVWRKDIGKPSVIPARKKQYTDPIGQPIKRYAWSAWKEGEEGWPHRSQTKEPPCNEIFLDDVHKPHTNEAYTTVHLPASASDKGMASLQVKVDTWASGNVLPLCLFRHLYPDCNDKVGHPTGLNASNTRLTTSTMVPRYPSLDHFMGLSYGILVSPVHNPAR